MNRQLLLLIVACLLLGLLMVLGSRSEGAGGSVRNDGPNGLSGLSAAIEALGREVEWLDQPLFEIASEETTGPARSVVVLAFPWQRPAEPDLIAAIDRRRLDGHDVLVAYSSGALALAEEAVLADLGIDMEDSFGFGPMNPLAWRKALAEPQSLDAEDARVGAVAAQRLRRTPDLSIRQGSEFEVLLSDDRGNPVAFVWRGRSAQEGGRLFVVPASVLSNAYLAEEANARFLWSLAEQLPDRWQFDEYHHGMQPAGAAATSLPRVFDALALQLVVLYLLAVTMLARRFHSAWPILESRMSNHRDYLEGIGQLHLRSGHAREAALRLWQRFAAYAPTFPRWRRLRQAIGVPSLGVGDLDPALERPPALEPLLDELGETDEERFLKLAQLLSTSPSTAVDDPTEDRKDLNSS